MPEDSSSLALPALSSRVPYSLEAEQAVLGSILKDPSCLQRVVLKVKPEYFHMPEHREIYTHIQLLDQLHGGRFDALLVLDSLKKHNIYSDSEGRSYLVRLAEAVPSVENVEYYCDILKEKYYLREIINVAQGLLSDASSETEKAELLLDRAEQQIYDIRRGQTVSGPVKLMDLFGGLYERWQQLTSENREQYLGLSTGFADLDRVTTGLNKSDLILIGARPAMGKTSFALNIARNAAVAGNHKVVVFSLEMSCEQLAQRLLACEARIDSTKLRTGDLSPDEWNRLTGAAVFLSNYEIYLDDSSNITVPEMKARVRRLKDVDCVVIDYLQLMTSPQKTENRVQEVSQITRSLKLMAKDLDIPIVTCAQLARGTEARGKSHKPQLSDLRESGSIEQDADIVMMLYREDYYNNDDKNPDVDQSSAQISVNTAQVIVAKNRHGPTDTVYLNWQPEFTLFSTQERHIEEQ